MAKVSFYLFEQSNERQVEITCRLCRKLMTKDQRVWLYSPDIQLLQTLDEELWTFDPSSFLAHGLDQLDAPICLSTRLPEQADWIVFNFQSEALEQFEKFSHIIEIVENTELAKQAGREKYKQYRRYGIEPRTFKL